MGASRVAASEVARHSGRARVERSRQPHHGRAARTDPERAHHLARLHAAGHVRRAGPAKLAPTSGNRKRLARHRIAAWPRHAPSPPRSNAEEAGYSARQESRELVILKARYILARLEQAAASVHA